MNITTTDTRVDWITNSNGVRKSIVIIGDFRITLTQRRRGGGWTAADRREFDQTTRVFGAIDALVPEFAADEPFQGIAIPFKPEGAQDKMRASVWNAWKRATTAEAANRLVMLLDKLSGMEGISVPEDAIASVKFSQKAGCTMCPCSPGFVLGDRVRSNQDNENGPVDMWIENWANEAIEANLAEA